MGKELTQARERLLAESETLGISETVIEALSYPQMTLAASLPLERDDGHVEHLKAWRCQFSRHLGPAKGGIRFHESVNADETQTLAFWMTLKCALARLPFGGGKGGVQVNARDLSRREKQALCRTYAQTFAPILGPDRDIPAPDVATGAQEMAWMVDAYNLTTSTHNPHAFTGKPVVLGGAQGRTAATGHGGYHVLTVLKDALGLDIDGLTVAIQGFGNAGRYFARDIHEAGAKVIAVSDSSGTVTQEDGLDIPALIEAKEDGTSISDMSGQGGISDSADVLSTKADLLVPAALGDVITKDTIDSLACKVILELANGPVSPDCDAALRDKDIQVVPDILANSGGVIVSHLEWLQGRTGKALSAEDVNTRMEARLTESAEAVAERMKSDDCDGRQAAYRIAIERLAEAVCLQL